MMLTLAVTLVQIVFLAASFSGGAGAGTGWMSVLMCGSIPAATLPLVFMRFKYKRLEIDAPAADRRRFKASAFDAFGCF